MIACGGADIKSYAWSCSCKLGMAEIHRWSEQTLNPMRGHVLVDYAWQKSIGGRSRH